MSGAELYRTFERQLNVAKQQFEFTKADLFRRPLNSDELALRRAYVRELEVCLGNMHETRRAIQHFQGR
jgi:hypothetical protein